MLTDTEKSKVRSMLGYPNAYRYKNTRLESMLSDSDNDTSVQIRACIVGVETAVTELETYSIEGAGLKRVDEIWFDNSGANSRSASLIRSGRRHIARLSIILGCPIANDYFGTLGYAGDSFSQGGSPSGYNNFG